MKSNKKQLLCFLFILFLWLFCSQEIYLFKAPLTHAVFTRYIIYFFWIGATCITGYIAWKSIPQIWVRKTWIILYTIVFIVLLLLGTIDLFFLHFTKAQKSYIQSFRLFFQSPVPFVIFYFLLKMSSQPVQQADEAYNKKAA